MTEKKLNKIQMKGITWDHSRGIVPLQAASQRFGELNPGVSIEWSKRSLQEFADYPIEELTKFYDLLIIDHPWVGTAAVTGCVIPLNEYLAEEFMKELSQNSVGRSHESYFYKGGQWALAIDGASPVASYRKDLFDANKTEVPKTWDDLISLAEKGVVAVPAIPIDLLMNFYSFCIASGAEPFNNENEVVDFQTGSRALKVMKELYSRVDSSMFTKNPIAVAELMAASDDYWYCPFAYCYTNYSRRGYGKNVLSYGNTVTIDGYELKTTLGGTGLAVSEFSEHKDTALKFAEMVCAPFWQATEYIYNGGQPGYSFGWEKDFNNRLTNNFFNECRPVIDRSYVRPRYHGYLQFQDEAGDYIQAYLKDGGNETAVLKQLNECYIRSLQYSRKADTAK